MPLELGSDSSFLLLFALLRPMRGCRQVGCISTREECSNDVSTKEDSSSRSTNEDREGNKCRLLGNEEKRK